MKQINNKILSDITVHMKYAKYVPELKRRETWEELVDRNKQMHIRKKFYQVCDRFSLAANQLRSVQIDYTTVHTYLSTMLIALVSVCFFCYLVAVLVILFNSIM